MDSLPLLSRVKSWQFFCLGIAGWITLYSAALLSWGAASLTVGNAQGGCFATAMTLASVEARRHQKRKSTPADSLQWVSGLTTEDLNQTLARSLHQQKLLVEEPHPIEAELGFGLRAVKSGRTLVFETSRWREPVIDLAHAQTTEENRNKIRADLAIIVGAGKPDDDTQAFVNNHFLKLLVGEELKAMFPEEILNVTDPQPRPEAEPEKDKPSPPAHAA